MKTSERVSAWYSSQDPLQRIDAQMRAQGIDPEHPTLEALAPLDNFHSRGIGATIDQIALAAFPAGVRVLDVGGGLGGPARALASRTTVHVTVLDLTPTFVTAGRVLTERLGMNDRVDFELGDGTKMPFADTSFDGVWTQHSTMNIEHKHALYAEIHRVLQPGGRLVMHEIMEGNGDPVTYPMPWASSPEFSFLRPVAEIRALIAAAGFRELVWEDESQRVLQDIAAAAGGPPPQAALFGPDFVERIRNFGDDLRDGRLAVIRALFERV